MNREKTSQNIAAIVQVRMGSTRLPGKALVDIKGRPLLQHVIERVKGSRYVKQVIVATTISPNDEAIIGFAAARDMAYFAGSEEDVLDRFYQAARQYRAEIIVRITPDDPFKDPEVIDKVIGCYLEHKVDYASNTIEPTYPEGIDVEVFSFAALEKAWREAKKPSEREHVTPHIWSHPELFRLLNVKNDRDLSQFRWTLDTEADLEFARAVYARLYHGQVFLMNDILALLEKEPELISINSGYARNAGYLESLKRESGQFEGRNDA